jgi:hypothetical protein
MSKSIVELEIEENLRVEKMVDELPDPRIAPLYYKLKSKTIQLETLIPEVKELQTKLQELCSHPKVVEHIDWDGHSNSVYYSCKVCKDSLRRIDSAKSKVIQTIRC